MHGFLQTLDAGKYRAVIGEEILDVAQEES